MLDTSFDAEAFDCYADRVRSGPVDFYAAYRLFEQHWHLRSRDHKQVLRKAALLLLAHDPWFLATGHVIFLRHWLTRRDVVGLTPRLGTGLPAGAAAYLRAKLWFHAVPRGGGNTIRHTLTLLRRVPRRYRQVGWHEMVVGCHERSGNWQAYARAFPRLFDLTEPEWRSSLLPDILESAARHRDWRAYDRWRREWNKLPPNRHCCHCVTHSVAILEGLRAVAEGRWDEVPQHLANAAAVNGCPHLNSGGFRLDLVKLLVRKRRHLDACRAFLDRAACFHSTKQLVVLRKAVERAAATKGDGAARSA